MKPVLHFVIHDCSTWNASKNHARLHCKSRKLMVSGLEAGRDPGASSRRWPGVAGARASNAAPPQPLSPFAPRSLRAAEKCPPIELGAFSPRRLTDRRHGDPSISPQSSVTAWGKGEAGAETANHAPAAQRAIPRRAQAPAYPAAEDQPGPARSGRYGRGHCVRGTGRWASCHSDLSVWIGGLVAGVRIVAQPDGGLA